ncbi:hypothetical protein ACTA71_010706 [Dictyostelium dimigraforme]
MQIFSINTAITNTCKMLQINNNNNNNNLQQISASSIETNGYRNNLFNFEIGSNVIFKSTTNNFPKGDGFIISLDNSNIDINNCKIYNSESPFLKSTLSNKSNISIISTNVLKSFDQLPLA